MNDSIEDFIKNHIIVCGVPKHEQKPIIDTDKTNKLHKPVIDADERQKEQEPIIIVEWLKNGTYLERRTGYGN